MLTKTKGFALIDVIVAITLVTAIAVAGVSYVMKNQSLILKATNASTITQEFTAYVYTCMQEAAHNKSTQYGNDVPLNCEDIGLCINSHLPGSVGNIPKWELEPGWTIEVLPHDGTLDSDSSDVTFMISVTGVEAQYLPLVICRDSINTVTNKCSDDSDCISGSCVNYYCISP